MVADMNEHSVLEMASDLWRRKKWLFIVIFLLVLTAAVGLVAGLPSLYRATTTVVLSQDDMAESMVGSEGGQELELRLATLRKAVLGRESVRQLITEQDLYPDERREGFSESLIQRFRKDVSIEQNTPTEPRWRESSALIITIGYQYWEPEKAADVANELAARFRAENATIQSAQTARATGFLADQVAAAKARLDRQERRMNAFKSANSTELPEQQYFNISTLERLNDQLRRNTERRNELLRIRYGLPLGAEEVGSTPFTAGLAGNLRLERLRRDLRAARIRYTDAHPRVVKLKQEIDSLEASLAAGTDSSGGGSGDPALAADPDLEELRVEEARLKSEIAAVTRRIEAAPGVSQQLEKLTLDYQAAKDAYLSLLELQRNAELAESLQGDEAQQFRVLEAAVPPEMPVAPNRVALLVMGLILAAGAAGAVVFLTALFDRGFHSLKDIRRFTGVPVLASIGAIPASGKRDGWRRGLRLTTASVVVLAGLLAVAVATSYVGEHAQDLVRTVAR